MQDDGDDTKEITGATPDDTIIARYEYEGQNRRIAKQVYTGGSLDHTLDMYYNENWQILEVRKDGNANPLKQYVWHTYYIDAPAIRYYDPDTDGSNIETQYFTHDANFNVTALTDNTGAVIERYDYTPYGQVTILNPNFSDDADGVSDYEQDVLFAGYQYDVESGLYQVRHRNYHPMLGRWIARDSLNQRFPGGGYHDGMSVYQYVKSSPQNNTDYNGLETFPYPDPDQFDEELGRLNPQRSVAEITISISGNLLCQLGAEENAEVIVNVHVNTSWDNFNEIASRAGLVTIDGAPTPFPDRAPGVPNSRASEVSRRYRQDGCPVGVQRGSGTIRLVDLTRRGRRGMTGVAQIFEYSWEYECLAVVDPEGGRCCQLEYFDSKVELRQQNTVNPNLPLR